jgi:hypothetical protein
MEYVYQPELRTHVDQWIDDALLSDEVLANLKEAADTNCVLCELDDLGEEE